MHTLILEPEGYSPQALEAYRSLGPVWLRDPPADLADISLVVVRLGCRLDERFLDKFPSLAAIASPTTGLTHIDLDACQRRNITVFSLAHCREAIELVTSTSELTLGLIIALLRRIIKAHDDVIRQGLWERDRYRSRQLSNLTLGIIGLGRIGGHVSGYARALGMQVLACDPYQSRERFKELNVVQLDFTSLLEQSDIVSIHANLRDDNQNMLGAEQIARMQPGALLVNTARGALLDELAVVSALRAGKIAGVAVDVLASEHSSDQWEVSPLVTAAREGLNIIITPHIGGCTSDAMHITEECLAKVVVHTIRDNL